MVEALAFGLADVGVEAGAGLAAADIGIGAADVGALAAGDIAAGATESAATLGADIGGQLSAADLAAGATESAATLGTEGAGAAFDVSGGGTLAAEGAGAAPAFPQGAGTAAGDFFSAGGLQGTFPNPPATPLAGELAGTTASSATFSPAGGTALSPQTAATLGDVSPFGGNLSDIGDLSGFRTLTGEPLNFSGGFTPGNFGAPAVPGVETETTFGPATTSLGTETPTTPTTTGGLNFSGLNTEITETPEAVPGPANIGLGTETPTTAAQVPGTIGGEEALSQALAEGNQSAQENLSAIESSIPPSSLTQTAQLGTETAPPGPEMGTGPLFGFAQNVPFSAETNIAIPGIAVDETGLGSNLAQPGQALSGITGNLADLGNFGVNQGIVPGVDVTGPGVPGISVGTQGFNTADAVANVDAAEAAASGFGAQTPGETAAAVTDPGAASAVSSGADAAAATAAADAGGADPGGGGTSSGDPADPASLTQLTPPDTGFGLSDSDIQQMDVMASGQDFSGSDIPVRQVATQSITPDLGASPTDIAQMDALASSQTPALQTGAVSQTPGFAQAGPAAVSESPAFRAPQGGGADVLGGFNMKQLGPLLGLGLVGSRLIQGPGKLAPQDIQAQGLATTEGNFGQQSLNLAMAGQITPSQEQQIADYIQKAQNQLYQQLASAGIDPRSSTQFQQGMQQIQANAMALRQQYITALINQGIAATGAATGTLNRVAQDRMRLDTTFQQALAQAAQALGFASGVKAQQPNQNTGGGVFT